jgi:hypothetical protein
MNKDLINQLNKGLLLEASNRFIPWRTNIKTLVNYGQPLIKELSEQRTNIIWQRESILNGLTLDLIVMSWNGIGRINRKFKHAYGNLSEEDFERIINRLCDEFGQEAKYRKYSDLEYSYTWYLGECKVMLSQLERFGSYWQVDIQHKSSWYGF